MQAIPNGLGHRRQAGCHRYCLPQEAVVFTDHFAVEYAVLISLQVHEVMALGVLVAVFELLRRGVQELDVVRRANLVVVVEPLWRFLIVVWTNPACLPCVR